MACNFCQDSNNLTAKIWKKQNKTKSFGNFKIKFFRIGAGVSWVEEGRWRYTRPFGMFKLRSNNEWHDAVSFLLPENIYGGRDKMFTGEFLHQGTYEALTMSLFTLAPLIGRYWWPNYMVQRQTKEAWAERDWNKKGRETKEKRLRK